MSLLALHDITVRFGPTLALSDVSLDLLPGEVHCVVGENGAGKTTLMHVAAGLLRPGRGYVEVKRPAEVAVVFQKLMLVERLTALENILLSLPGLHYFRPGRLGRRQVEQACQRWGLTMDLDASVETLSGGEKQRVALVRALVREAPILVLDEPTALLSASEVDSLFALLRCLKAEGKGVFFIGHKLPEVMAIADKVSVLHRGHLVCRGEAARALTQADLAAMMVGIGPGQGASAGAVRPQASLATVPPESAPGPALQGPAVRPAGSEPVLRLSHVWLEPGFGESSWSLSVAAGEIVGIAGVAGNGQKRLAEVAAGLQPLSGGEVWLGARNMTGSAPGEFLREGVRYLTEDRLREGSHPDLAAWEGVAIRGVLAGPGRALSTLRKDEMALQTSEIIRKYEVVCPGPEARMGALSGGNLQKLLLGRELMGKPRLLVVHEPTQGLDLNATATLRARLVELASQGVAVLLISSDLDEVMELSHRLCVLSRGKLVGELRREAEGGFDRRQIGAWMAGMELSAGDKAECKGEA